MPSKKSGVDRMRASPGTAPRTPGGTPRSAAIASRTPMRSRAAAPRGRAGRAAGCRRGSPSVAPQPSQTSSPDSTSSRARSDSSRSGSRESGQTRSRRGSLHAVPRQRRRWRRRRVRGACGALLRPSAGARAGTRRASTAASGGRGGPRGARRRSRSTSGGVEDALRSQARRRELVVERLAQLALEPLGDRDPEALLRRGRDPGRQRVRHRPLQQVLRVEAAQLEARRHAAEELDELDVEEGRAHLERARHARPVDLHQDVVLQVGRRVRGRSGARAGSVGRRCEAPPLLRERVAGCAVEQGRLLVGRERAEPRRDDGRRPGSRRSAEEALDLEVEAEVRRRDREPVGERGDDALVERAAARGRVARRGPPGRSGSPRAARRSRRRRGRP